MTDSTIKSHHVIGGDMARHFSGILSKNGAGAWFHDETGAELAGLARRLVADPNTKIVFLDSESDLGLRARRKDLFVIETKITKGLSENDQYATGLDLLKRESINLVLAHDVLTHRNMVIAPEEAHYFETHDLDATMEGLARMAVSRSTNHFTRSAVIDNAALVPWNSPDVPGSLRHVVDHLIMRGAYQPFRGKTAGHFAVKAAGENEFLTSIRKSNFNNLAKTGLVRVVTKGNDEVVAYGAKPSVGGQSQRIVFTQHADKALDCIVHFHGALRDKPADAIPLRDQWKYECGSHECGQNTADGLREVRPGIHAVMLDNHGPNIVFPRSTPAAAVIDFIESNFALGQKTGGAIPAAYRI